MSGVNSISLLHSAVTVLYTATEQCRASNKTIQKLKQQQTDRQTTDDNTI